MALFYTNKDQVSLGVYGIEQVLVVGIDAEAVDEALRVRLQEETPINYQLNRRPP
jgi:hypothetical protein